MSILEIQKFYWSRRRFAVSALSSLFMLSVALIINYFAGIEASKNISNVVKDIILDNIPVLDVSFLVLQAAALFILVVTVYLILTPQKLPFTIKSISIFIIIRSVFINLTHMAPYLGFEYQQSYIDTHDFLQKFTFGGDLFFSGHTGLPFLLALIFWRHQFLRVFFLFSSIISAGAVLLGHLHYSIDVFAAFFITYSIFSICKYLFKKDWELFEKGLPA